MARYRLDPVRDQRERDERVKRGDLASAVGAARTTQSDVDRAARRVADLRAQIEQASAKRAALAELVQPTSAHALADRFLARLRNELDGAIGAELRARAAHAGKLAEIDEARGRLVVARADREVIERHFAAWRDAKKRAAERRDD